MYKVKSNAEIGKYLSGLINKKFSSQRLFCKAYLETETTITPDEDKIQNMANRISQIIKGNKAVQLNDFPIFAELLGVSCEEILSAGECSAPTMNHLTNYNIAFSRDEKLWEEYVHREEQLILNIDEYGKTVIDYALEFKNFGFLKFLITNNYLWFVDVATDPKDYFRKYAGMNFGPGTGIERSSQQDRDAIRWRISCPQNNSHFENRYPCGAVTLPNVLAGNDDFRMRMISLAIEHGEVDMLHQLRAREIPSLYRSCYLSYSSADCESYYNEDMVKHIAGAGEEILNYFLEEFEIKDMCGRTNIFVFPYMMNLIDFLIKENSPYLNRALKIALEYNQNVYKKLVKSKKDSMEYYKKYYEEISQFRDAAGVLHSVMGDEYVKSCVEGTINSIMEHTRFFENGSIIIYRDGGTRDGLVANIIHISENSDKREISSMIQEVNEWYNKIRSKNF